MVRQSTATYKILLPIVVTPSKTTNSDGSNGAHVYYVSTTGNDSNPGTLASPWRTIQKAASTLVAGDTVLIRQGLYASASRIEPKNSGTANAYITYKAYPGEHPEIRTGQSQGFFIAGTSTALKGYIEINGLTVTAAPAYTTESCGSGIYTEYGHHIRVLNNVVKGSGASGIVFETGSDYAYVQGNIVLDNGWGCSRFRGSAINFHRIKWFDQAAGYHNIVRRNLVYHNYHDPKYVLNHTDGNAFIVDQSNSINASGTNPPVLIENNVAFNNAGPCLDVFDSSNTTFINNTCYHNAADTAEVNPAEISIDGSSNIRAYNNIFVPRSGARATRQGMSSSNLVFDYNLSFGGTADVKGSHDITGKDPLFINPTIDPATANFHLKLGSPAIDAALASYSPTIDFDGAARPQGAASDLGGYEFAQ